jgi:hypothetical protein
MSKHNLNFGNDPEVFATIELDGKEVVISPALLEREGLISPVIPDKSLKHPVYINRPGEYSWMMDGVAFELTNAKILKSAKETYEQMNAALSELEEFLSGIQFRDQTLKLHKRPVVDIEPEMYLPFIEKDKKIFQGFIFGCDPDLDAVDTGYNCITLNVSEHKFRYGGGHFHVSGHELFELAPRPAIQLLAVCMGNYCIANSPFPEQERQRATTYGRPGRYREQRYKDGSVGVEYRTPSNSWISYPLDKMEGLFDQAYKAFEFLLNPQKGKSILAEYLDSTCKAIINADQELANSILSSI